MAIGVLQAQEITRACCACSHPTHYRSAQLAKLVAHGCVYGYDVMVHVGKSVYLQCRDEHSIQVELQHRLGIPIPRSQIGYLAKKFIVYLAIAHSQARTQVVEKMQREGGYVLHLDGTSEADSPHLISALDGLSEIVLDNIKAPTESCEQLIPFLQRIKQSYGPPIALVHDMSTAILKAVATVFPGVADFVCHFHFLRDIGKDLLAADNDCIRKRLRKHGTQKFLRYQMSLLRGDAGKCEHMMETILENSQTKAPETPAPFALLVYLLLAWALDGKRQGDGYGFPFDRIHLSFYRRLVRVYTIVYDLNRRISSNVPHRRTLGKVCKKLRDIIGDRQLKNAAKRMEKNGSVFDQLRHAMRIALPEGKDGLNDEGGGQEMPLIRQKLTLFREKFTQGKHADDQALQSIIAQLDKYWDKLLADPIIKHTPTGPVTICPQRTNNILEQFFRDFRRNQRKRTGNNSLTRLLKTMLSDTPLVKNLDNPEYVALISGNAKTLQERFAQIDHHLVQEEMRTQKEINQNLSPKLRKLIAHEGLADKIAEIAPFAL